LFLVFVFSFSFDFFMRILYIYILSSSFSSLSLSLFVIVSLTELALHTIILCICIFIYSLQTAPHPPLPCYLLRSWQRSRPAVKHHTKPLELTLLFVNSAAAPRQMERERQKTKNKTKIALKYISPKHLFLCCWENKKFNLQMITQVKAPSFLATPAPHFLSNYTATRQENYGAYDFQCRLHWIRSGVSFDGSLLPFQRTATMFWQALNYWQSRKITPCTLQTYFTKGEMPTFGSHAAESCFAWTNKSMTQILKWANRDRTCERTSQNTIRLSTLS